jgi:arylsulfatase A-like enzyme
MQVNRYLKKNSEGLAEPMMISSPIHKHRKNSVTYSMTSLLDIVPTILDWFNVTYTDQSLDSNEISPPQLTGKSLLSLLREGIYIHIKRSLQKFTAK